MHIFNQKYAYIPSKICISSDGYINLLYINCLSFCFANK